METQKSQTKQAMELTLDFRPPKPRRAEIAALELETLTRRWSDHAHSPQTASKELDATIASHISPNLLFISNNKKISGREAYVDFHQRVLALRPKLTYRIWDLKADVAESGTRGTVWLTAELAGLVELQRLECSFVYEWRFQSETRRWVCGRITGLTSMGFFSNGLF